METGKHGKLTVLYFGFLIFCVVLISPIESYCQQELPVYFTAALASTPQPGKPVPIDIRVDIKIPFSDAKLILKLPGIGDRPWEDVLIWSSKAEDIQFPHLFTYIVPALPPEHYIFNALLVITTRDYAEVMMKVGNSSVIDEDPKTKEYIVQIKHGIYLDARPDIIYYGSSFEDIERTELIKEIWKKNDKGPMELPYEELGNKPLKELEEMNGGPWSKSARPVKGGDNRPAPRVLTNAGGGQWNMKLEAGDAPNPGTGDNGQ